MSVHSPIVSDFFIDEAILSRLCWERDNEFGTEEAPFCYSLLCKLIRLMRTHKFPRSIQTYPKKVSFLLDMHHVRDKVRRSSYHALLSQYFKAVKRTRKRPADYGGWSIFVEDHQQGFSLYHTITLSRSATILYGSYIDTGGFEVERRPCRNTMIIELHRRKSVEIAHRILSGKL